MGNEFMVGSKARKVLWRQISKNNIKKENRICGFFVVACEHNNVKSHFIKLRNCVFA